MVTQDNRVSRGVFLSNKGTGLLVKKRNVILLILKHYNRLENLSNAPPIKICGQSKIYSSWQYHQYLWRIIRWTSIGHKWYTLIFVASGDQQPYATNQQTYNWNILGLYYHWCSLSGFIYKTFIDCSNLNPYRRVKG